MRSSLALYLGVPILVAAVASPAASQTMRDSAGITIVENPAPDTTRRLFRLVEQFRVSDSVPGERWLSLTSLARLPDGRFVTEDVNGGQLRYLDSAGKLLQIVDAPVRQGERSSSIRGIMGTRGDSILVWRDGSKPSLLLDGRGAMGRELLPQRRQTLPNSSFVPGTEPVEQTYGIFSDGSLVAQGRRSAVTSAMTWTTPGGPDRRRPAVYLHYSADGERLLDTLGIFPGSDQTPSYEIAEPAGARRMTSTLTIPGFRRTSVEIDSDRVVVAEGSTYEIRTYSPSGGLTRIIRAAVPPRPFTSDVIAQVKERLTAPMTPYVRRSAVDAMSRLSFPPYQAAFGRVIVDDAHRIWVEEVSAGVEALNWTVFDREGRLLGSVALPPSHGRPIWIGESAIAFRPRGSLVVYRLVPLR